tara:strand:- start:537 stop:926 length:390 start_codon:yes stop_codon:yes gene_type:complete
MNKVKNILRFLILISIVFIINQTKLEAIGNVDWILLKENKDGKEWLDLGSLKVFNNSEISVLTRFYKNPSKDKNNAETTLYVMRINCKTKEYKDTSINGIPQFKSSWQKSYDDELLDIVLDRSCSEAGL